MLLYNDYVMIISCIAQDSKFPLLPALVTSRHPFLSEHEHQHHWLPVWYPVPPTATLAASHLGKPAEISHDPSSPFERRTWTGDARTDFSGCKLPDIPLKPSSATATERLFHTNLLIGWFTVKFCDYCISETYIHFRKLDCNFVCFLNRVMTWVYSHNWFWLLTKIFK